MKPSGVVLCVVFAAVALAATVWIGRYRGATPEILKSPDTVASPGPAISPTGPYPKAVAPETEYNFGVLALGAEGQHDYAIHNEGEADLVVMARPEDTTCSCTVGKLSHEGPIKPGESVTVTLNWKVKLAQPEFRHRAIIRTNDPEHKEIELVVSGSIDETIRVSPLQNWPIGDLSSTEPTTITGEVYSTNREKFDIVEVMPGKETTKVEWKPMTPELLAEKNYKSGYLLTVTLPPDVPIGPYSDTVKVKTSEEVAGEVTFTVSGSRTGPLEIIGPKFHTAANVLKMEEFPADKGMELTLSMFVKNFDGELKLEDVKQQFDSVKVTLVKDERFTGKDKQRYYLKISVPPGPPQDRRFKNSEKVDLFLNHPDARQVRLIVDFLALPSDV
jgi:hypothetical protein